MSRLKQWWNERHRHDWQGYGGGRACKVCRSCGQYRCEDGAYGYMTASEMKRILP